MARLREAHAGPKSLAPRALIALAAGGLRLSELRVLTSSNVVRRPGPAVSVEIRTSAKSGHRMIAIDGDDARALLDYVGALGPGALLGSAAEIWAGLDAGFPFHAFRHALADRLMRNA